MRKIVVGSTNKTKVGAVKEHFHAHDVEAYDASSGVSSQPKSDEETRLGAYNRAKNARSLYENCIGIGLEGGVMQLADKLYLCNWGVLIDENNNMFTASGARIELPNIFIEQIEAGKELSDIMEQYTKKKGIRHYEGAVGIFTNGRILRQQLFEHVVLLLKGQFEYGNVKNGLTKRE